MKQFLKAHRNKIWALLCDALCVVAAVIARPLSAYMLQKGGQACIWNLQGVRCLSCGGTHFVYDLLSGRVWQAFSDNQLLFVLTVFLLVTLIMLNLWLLFDLAFAKKALKWMYHIPTLIIFLLGAIVFVIWRNPDAFDELLLVFKRIGEIPA